MPVEELLLALFSVLELGALLLDELAEPIDLVLEDLLPWELL